MRAIVTSSNSWSDAQIVVDALCELPAGTVILLPTKSGACKTVIENVEDLKLEIEDWSTNDEQYEKCGSGINADMIESDVDICFAFINKTSHTAKDLVRRARSMDLDVRVFEE